MAGAPRRLAGWSMARSRIIYVERELESVSVCERTYRSLIVAVLWCPLILYTQFQTARYIYTHTRSVLRARRLPTVTRASASFYYEILWIIFSLCMRWHVPSSIVRSEEMSVDQSLRRAVGVFGCAKTTKPFGRSIFA